MIAKEILNAKVICLKWDNERGLTHYITIEGDSWGCSIGGYHLAGDAAYKWIMQLMKVFDTCSFEDKDIVGRIVRGKFENGRIVAIGHPYKDVWLEPKKLFEKGE